MPVATTAERVEQRVVHVDQAAKKAVLAKLLGEPDGDPGDRLHPHQAPRRPGDPPSSGRGRRGRGHSRQQVAEQPRAGAGRLQGRHAPRCWSRPTSPRAASTSTPSATWSTSTCPTCPRPTSTASAAPPAPARRGCAIAFCSADEIVELARHRGPDPAARAGPGGRGQPLDGRGRGSRAARGQPPRGAARPFGCARQPRRARLLPALRCAAGGQWSIGSARWRPVGSGPARAVRRHALRDRVQQRSIRLAVGGSRRRHRRRPVRLG